MDRQEILTDFLIRLKLSAMKWHNVKIMNSDKVKILSPFSLDCWQWENCCIEMNETFEDIELEPSAFEKIIRTISDSQ